MGLEFSAPVGHYLLGIISPDSFLIRSHVGNAVKTASATLLWVTLTHKTAIIEANLSKMRKKLNMAFSLGGLGKIAHFAQNANCGFPMATGYITK
jgi:hypothetical protein